MRITDSMIYSNAQSSVASALSKVTAATAETSSGLAVVQPGDDPAAAAGVVVHATAGAYATAVSSSATAAVGELNIADSALNTVSNAVSQASQLAVQLENSSYSAADRQNAAAQVGQIFQEVISSLNVKSGDRYVFSGSKDQTPPFDAAGNYDGDTEVRTIEVAPGVQQAASVRADVAIKGTGGGVDVLGAIAALQTALQNNDTAGIQTAIGALATGTNQIATMRSQVGADQDALSAAASVAQSASTAEQTAVSNLQNADVVQAATQLQLAQTALQAAVSASTTSFKFSLLNPTG